MKIELEVGDFDHEAVIEMMLPIIIENKDAIENKTLSNLAKMAGTMKISGNTVAKMVSRIPKDVKNEIIVYFVNNHKETVIKFMEKIMAKNGFNVKLNNIKIEKD